MSDSAEDDPAQAQPPARQARQGGEGQHVSAEARTAGVFREASPGELAAIERSESFWSGPIPSGGELDKYNGVMEGGANRVMALIEKQANHRQDLESKSVQADITLRQWGLALGFILSLIAVVGGIVLVAVGKEIGALAALLPGIAGLAGVFVWWQKQRTDKPSQQPPRGDSKTGG